MKKPHMNNGVPIKTTRSNPVPTGKRTHYIPEMKCSILVDVNSTPEEVQQRASAFVLRYNRSQTDLYKITTGFKPIAKIGR